MTSVHGLIDCCSTFAVAGIIYDVIVEPPSVGSMTDEHGHQRPVAFLAYRWVPQDVLQVSRTRS